MYFSVLLVFVVFAVAFIGFQLVRERQYKVSLLTVQLQDCNDRLADVLRAQPHGSSAALHRWLAGQALAELRLTLIAPDGKVVYDSRHNAALMANHRQRDEVAQALTKGKGLAQERRSSTLGGEFFYAASYYPDLRLVIRTSLPYDVQLLHALEADQHFVWFALAAVAVLTLLLYRFAHQLSTNVNKLRLFATKADHNESLETEDLADFPNDELGEIAERIIKLYKRLQHTRQEQDVLKRQLTQNAAHELKTPVASIQGYLETILSNPEMDAQVQRAFLERCHAQAERLSSLLRDIATLGRLDDGAHLIDFQTVDVAAMVHMLQQDTVATAEQKGMHLQWQLPSSVMVRGNESLIYSILRNLVDNALAYAGQGTTLQLTAHLEGLRWHFTFQDNGVGVEAEHLPRLFERFYRVDKGRSRKMGGTGLGLAIVRNAVTVHGGTIRASQAEGGGLRFDFTLPVAH